MINISNCPITGLKRKLNYDFYWLASVRQIIVRCVVSHFSEEDELIANSRIVNYMRELVASDSKVHPITGHIFTPEELEAEPEWIYEYDFYVNVLGVTHLILPILIESIIQTRDAEGKFDI